MTPDEFEAEMRKITEYAEPLDDCEAIYLATGSNEGERHQAADLLVRVLLESLGYTQGAQLFACMSKWFE